MDRPRSTSKSLPFSSCSPSGVPTPLSIPTPQGIRRSHLTPTSGVLDGELSISKIERLSPHQRTPTAMETGTPRLAAAVSEAKRSGASAPSPSLTDIPMDQFDRLLSKNIRFAGTPTPTTRDETGSPSVVTRAVHSVLADESKRRELLLSLQKLFQGGAPANPSNSNGSKGTGSRNNTPRLSTPLGQQDSSMQNISTIARAAREVSPLHHSGGNAEWQHGDPVPFTQQPRNGICRPKPTERTLEAKRIFAAGLAMRQTPTSQKVIKSEMSAFSETTESSSLTSYSTTKSAKATRGEGSTMVVNH